MPKSYRAGTAEYNIAAAVWIVLGCLLFISATSAGAHVYPAPTPLTRAAQIPLEALPPDVRIEPVLTRLNEPVAMAFAPDGRLFFTERTLGEVFSFTLGDTFVVSIYKVTLASTDGERGLIGLALDPNFLQNHYIYIYYTSNEDNDVWHNRVVRFTLQDNGQGDSLRLLLKVPLESEFISIHNGGNLHFGPDGKLYVSLGDYGNWANAQNLGTLAGKILRINPANGSGLPDNPWYGSGNANTDRIYARGFRNPFDFDFDPVSGQMFAEDNGTSCDDEVNRVLRGYTYGWRTNYPPCEDSAPGGPNPAYNTIPPLFFWTQSVAPTGVTFYRGDAIPEWKNDLFVCLWKTGELHHFKLNTARTAIASHTIISDPALGTALCHLDIETGPDGALYFFRKNDSDPDRLRDLYRLTRDATFYASAFTASSAALASGDTLTYTLRLVHYGALTTTFTVTSSLPPATALIDGSPHTASGMIIGSGAGVTWTGSITPNSSLLATYRVTVSAQITLPMALTNVMRVTSNYAGSIERAAVVIVNGRAVYLPLMQRATAP